MRGATNGMNTRVMNKKSTTVDWCRMIGVIIDGLESERFPELFIDQLGRLVAFDLAAIFVYRGRSRPLPVYDNFHLAGAQRGIAAYVESSYVLNPVSYPRMGVPPVHRPWRRAAWILSRVRSAATSRSI